MKPRIRHIYPKDEKPTAQYVEMLAQLMGQETLSEEHPDIVHLHGCWHKGLITEARRFGARIVLSPHGQLQPWIMQEERIKQMLTGQRHLVGECYAVVAQGKMEHDNLLTQGWNPRVEVVPNPLITQTVSPEEAVARLNAIYRKVMDSNVWALMNDDTRRMVAILLKAGITDDSRWITDDVPAEPDWQQIAIFAHYEQVDYLIELGKKVMGLNPPPIDATTIATYLPDDYEPVEPSTDLETLLGDLHRAPTLNRLCALHVLLRKTDFNDDNFVDILRQRKQLKWGQRLMQVLARLTLLEEGFMPLPALDDKETDNIIRTITNHLAI